MLLPVDETPTPVLQPAFLGVVGAERLFLAVPDRLDAPLIPAWVSAFFTASARLVPSAHVVFDRATLVAVSLDREADVRVLLQKLRPACNEPC